MTEPLSNRRNSPLKSKAQISDGAARRFFVAKKKFALQIGGGL
jgi:hypothetical protein